MRIVDLELKQRELILAYRRGKLARLKIALSNGAIGEEEVLCDEVEVKLQEIEVEKARLRCDGIAAAWKREVDLPEESPTRKDRIQ